MLDTWYRPLQKNRLFTLRLASLCACVVLLPAHLQAKEAGVIQWSRYPFPPVYIETGEQRGEGIAGQTLKLLQRELTQYKHIDHSASFPRIMRSFTNTGVVCTGMNKTSDREQQVIFSQAVVMYPAHTLSYLTSRKRELEQSSGISLETSFPLQQLLEGDEQYSVGVTLNRSYNPQIDKLLNQHPEKIRSFEVSTPMASIYKQLRFRRLDFTIEYPIVTAYWLQKLGLENQFSSVPIKESGRGFVAYIACSRNPEGAKVIAAINKVLERVVGTVEHRAIVERWLPKQIKMPYRKLYSDYFNQGQPIE